LLRCDIDRDLPQDCEPGPQISIVVCSFNRAESLGRSLGALLAVEPPPGGFELIIVDNNSRDGTAKLVARAIDQREPTQPEIRYIFEPLQGLSRARNAGVRAARGRIVAFTDDDTLVPRDWLLQLHQAFVANPDAVIVGGAVMPQWEAEKPGWLTPDLNWMIALIDYGEEVMKVSTPCLVGANFACAAQILGPEPFDPSLGRVGENLFGGEETALQERVLSLGLPVYYVPAFQVRHVIGRDRLQKRFFRRLAFDLGRSAVRLRRRRHGAKRHRSRLPIAKSVWRTIGWAVTGRFCAAEMRCIMYLGFASGLLSDAFGTHAAQRAPVRQGLAPAPRQ
jgi:glycosyltransferase involved in cell wall biosynthesis